MTDIAVLRRMTARDPSEPHRASTPLELLFDLCFVVAVAQAAAQLHHSITEGRLGPGLLGYALVFFAIWWAWVNFTWFASAYDTDDVPYRLLTLVQIAGVLVLAAGVPAAFERLDFRTIVAGYVLMRLAMIAQWLRAARAHPAGRPAAIRYAIGIGVIQVCWILRLLLPAPWSGITFAVLILGELSVPAWAEFRGSATSWHPGHINERYGLFTLIVLGEAVAAATTAVQSAI
ncbi:MAG TPA: low temperature requirement protein A, partial [Amycolatopsis sp.]|nr:low temperature requirement protein A [Amycolatopsis sp.]